MSTTTQSSTRSPPRPSVRRDWVSKTLAGLVLGGLIALGGTGLFVQLNADMPLSVKGQLAMWMVAPIWLGVLSGAYFFSSGVRAWLWLGAATALVLGVFYSHILIDIGLFA